MSDLPSAVELPKVSVIMPIYNAGPHLSDAVQSILDQTFTDFEFVIVNDGSTDGSSGVLSKFSRGDPRIRLFSQPNGGMLAALNRAASLARGELLARMDADDISLPTRLQKQVQYMHAHPECVALGTRVLAVDPEGVPVREEFLLTSHDDIDAANFGGRCAMAHPTVIMRRSALDCFPPYRCDFAEDLDLWLRLGERGRLANLPEVLLKYRLHLGSASYSASYVKQATLDRVLREADERRGVQIPRPRIPENAAKPVSASVAPWLWCRLALAAGNYSSARILARKAAKRPGLRLTGAITFILAMLGPIGRTVLNWRNRVRRVA